MRKSVLIIDKPKKCDDCPCSYFTEGAQSDYCKVTDSEISNSNEVLKDCPLKDLPDKQVCNERDFEHYVNGYGKGWNDYRGHLTGEYNHYEPEPYKE